MSLPEQRRHAHREERRNVWDLGIASRIVHPLSQDSDRAHREERLSARRERRHHSVHPAHDLLDRLEHLARNVRREYPYLADHRTENCPGEVRDHALYRVPCLGVTRTVNCPGEARRCVAAEDEAAQRHALLQHCDEPNPGLLPSHEELPVLPQPASLVQAAPAPTLRQILPKLSLARHRRLWATCERSEPAPPVQRDRLLPASLAQQA